VKPFAVGELLARLDALQRRTQPAATQSETTLRVADLELNLLKRTVKRDGRSIELKPKEFLLLEYLMRHAGSSRHAHHVAEAFGITTSTPRPMSLMCTSPTCAPRSIKER